MTDRERLDRVREIAYTIVGPQQELIDEAMRLIDEISDPPTKGEAAGYMEMIAMASLITPRPPLAPSTKASAAKAFHLPGKHDQKAHGGGGGSSRDAYHDMDKELAQIEKGPARTRPAPAGPLTSPAVGIIADNAREVISQYDRYLAGETTTMLHKWVARFERQTGKGQEELAKAGVKAEDLDALMQDSVRKVVYQEIESNRQQFTDHGVRHITGNLQYQSRILDVLEEQGVPISAKDRLLADFVMVNHDMGYTVPAVRRGGPDGIAATKQHPEMGEKIAEAQKSKWNEGKVFTPKEYKRATGIIRTHQSSSLDMRDPVAFATRVADNTSLFQREKLPGVFARVPKSQDILVEMQKAKSGDDKPAFEKARADLHKAIDATSNLDPMLKRDLKAAAGEVNFFTPKFTIGTLAGHIEDVSATPTAAVSIKIQHNKFDQFLQDHFDMGQRQTKKLLEDYGVTDFTKDRYRLGKTPTGKAALEIEVIR